MNNIINATSIYKSLSGNDVHLKSIDKKIQDILNLILDRICSDENIDKNNIITAIKAKYPDYEKLCSKPSKSADGKCDSDDEIIFNDVRLGSIINQIKENNIVRRICKFKRQVILGKITNVPLSTVMYIEPYNMNNYSLYTLGRSPIVYFNPYRNNNFNMIPLFGGSDSKILYNTINQYGLGDMFDDSNESKSIEYLNFDDFEKQYFRDNKMNYSSNITIKICAINENKDMNCKTYTKNDSKGKNDSKYEEAYNNLQNFKKINSLNDALDEIDLILNNLEYYIVPYNTIKSIEKINK